MRVLTHFTAIFVIVNSHHVRSNVHSVGVFMTSHNCMHVYAFTRYTLCLVSGLAQPDPAREVAAIVKREEPE